MSRNSICFAEPPRHWSGANCLRRYAGKRREQQHPTADDEPAGGRDDE